MGLNSFTLGSTTAVTLQSGKKVECITAQGPGIRHAYEVSYKSSTAMKVTAKDGTVLPNELLEATTSYMAAVTEDYGSANKVIFLR